MTRQEYNYKRWIKKWQRIRKNADMSQFSDVIDAFEAEFATKFPAERAKLLDDDKLFPSDLLYLEET